MDCSISGFLSITISQSLLKLMSIESVMSSNNLILWHPLLLLPQILSVLGSFPRSQFFKQGLPLFPLFPHLFDFKRWDWMPWSYFFQCGVLSQLFHSSLSPSSRGHHIRVGLSAYLRLLIFFLAILSPVYTSSSPAFLMLYSAYKLNKQGDNIQPWHTHFPIWNQSIVPLSGSNCCFLSYIKIS